MNGSWGITGYNPGCGRRQLNSRLFAGQFTNMRNVSVFGFGGPRVVVNNYADTGFYNDGMSMPKWMQWTMLGGMGMSFLGNIFSAIFGGGGGGKTEGAGSKESKGSLSTADSQTLSMLKETYKDKCTITGPDGEGRYCLKDKASGTTTWFDDLEALRTHLTTNADYNGKKTSTDPTTATDPQKANGNDTKLKEAQAQLTKDGITDITAELDDNGNVVYRYGNETYESLDAAKDAKAKAKTQNTPGSTSVADGKGNEGDLEITIAPDGKTGISQAFVKALEAKGVTIPNNIPKAKWQAAMNKFAASITSGYSGGTDVSKTGNAYRGFRVTPGQKFTIPAAVVAEMKAELGITE